MELKRYKRMKLGEMLIAEGILSEEQLSHTLKEQKKKSDRIGNIIKKLGFATEDDIIRTLGKQMGVKYMSLSNIIADPKLLEKVPESIARKYQVIPLYKHDDNTITMAMVDPLNIVAIDKISELTGSYIEVVVSKENDIMSAIATSYKSTARQRPDKRSDTDDDTEESDGLLHVADEESPVIKLVNDIIIKALDEGASDIHIEPEEDEMRVRFRIDGILREDSISSREFYNSIVSRMKIMGEMDISEKRAPQDGRCQMKIGSRDIDIRVSTLPTIYGEKVVLRLLDRQNIHVKLATLGFPKNILTSFNQQIRRPYGMILVTGPTGSGKTSTLYAALNEINTLEKNIVTVEDPVEYQLRIINQVQVNSRAGLTFAHGLRTIMRQDPDIIMVGEIRDQETAAMAIQAALTGHLVLSTLHSNNTAASVTRLINMQIEPFLIASSLSCILAQRLIRKICPSCKEPAAAPSETLDRLNIKAGDNVFFRGKGCNMCRDTGYLGRIGVFEYMEVNNNLKDLISNKAVAADIYEQATQNGMASLREAAIKKALDGTSSLEEVLRVTTSNV